MKFFSEMIWKQDMPSARNKELYHQQAMHE